MVRCLNELGEIFLQYEEFVLNHLGKKYSIMILCNSTYLKLLSHMKVEFHKLADILLKFQLQHALAHQLWPLCKVIYTAVQIKIYMMITHTVLQSCRNMSEQLIDCSVWHDLLVIRKSITEIILSSAPAFPPRSKNTSVFKECRRWVPSPILQHKHFSNTYIISHVVLCSQDLDGSCGRNLLNSREIMFKGNLRARI